MSTRICVIYRIIIAVRIKIKSIRGIRIEVGGIIRRDKSAPSGVIVTRVQEVKPRFRIEVVASVANGIVTGEVISRVGCKLLISPRMQTYICN